MTTKEQKRLRELAQLYSYRCGECGPVFRRECPKCSDQAYAIEQAILAAIKPYRKALEAARRAIASSETELYNANHLPFDHPIREFNRKTFDAIYELTSEPASDGYRGGGGTR